MTNLIVEVSKYLMILLMAIYTMPISVSFFPGSGTEKSVQNRGGPCFFTAFSQHVVMYLKTEDETLRRMLLVFYMGQVVFFPVGVCRDRAGCAFSCMGSRKRSFGAQLSLTVGGISIQPSEFVKDQFCIFCSVHVYQSLV